MTPGGPRQRPPRIAIIFADEPTGNLDATTGAGVIDMLMSVVSEDKKTLIVVTHDQNLAQRGDRKLIIHDGGLVQREGAGEQLPAQRFGSGDGEREAPMTRQMPYEPWP